MFHYINNSSYRESYFFIYQPLTKTFTPQVKVFLFFPCLFQN
nr:MAG TPA: hypothetical protein [Caudoviricetes sp.]